MVDVNRDSVLTNAEWKGFWHIFVARFEADDLNHDYLLNAEELSMS